MIRLRLKAVPRLAIVLRLATASATGRKYMMARPVFQTCREEVVLILNSNPMPSRASAKEQPHVTSARGGTRVRKDLRRGLPVGFMEAVEHPTIASGRSVTSQLLQHVSASCRIR